MPLFRRRRPRPVELPLVRVSYGEGFPVEVRGESFHEPALRALAEAAGAEIDGERLQAEFTVAIRREPENRHDANAVAVQSMSGEPLGYLPHELAGEYSPVLAAAEERFQVCCETRAYGRLNGAEWNIGIWLALPDADQLADLIASVSPTDRDHPPPAASDCLVVLR